MPEVLEFVASFIIDLSTITHLLTTVDNVVHDRVDDIYHFGSIQSRGSISLNRFSRTLIPSRVDRERGMVAPNDP